MSVTVQAFLLCDSVDAGLLKPTALNFFDLLMASRFPVSRKCAIFCRLYLPDQAEYRLSILMETPTAVSRQLMPTTPRRPKPNGIIQLTCNIADLQLVHAGIYIFKLLVNDKAVSEFHLTVSRKDSPGNATIADRNYGFAIKQHEAAQDT
jgi:hypothetical protein